MKGLIEYKIDPQIKTRDDTTQHFFKLDLSRLQHNFYRSQVFYYR